MTKDGEVYYILLLVRRRVVFFLGGGGSKYFLGLPRDDVKNYEIH